MAKGKRKPDARNEANIHVATAADFLPRFGKPLLCDVMPDKDVQMRVAVFLEFQHTDKRETLTLMLSREQNAHLSPTITDVAVRPLAVLFRQPFRIKRQRNHSC